MDKENKLKTIMAVEYIKDIARTDKNKALEIAIKLIESAIEN